MYSQRNKDFGGSEIYSPARASDFGEADAAARPGTCTVKAGTSPFPSSAGMVFGGEATGITAACRECDAGRSEGRFTLLNTNQPDRARMRISAIVFVTERAFLFLAGGGITGALATSGRGGLFPAPN